MLWHVRMHACQISDTHAQEAEERVFTSVSNLKAGAGAADNDDEIEDTHNQSLLRSECLCLSLKPHTLTCHQGRTL